MLNYIDEPDTVIAEDPPGDGRRAKASKRLTDPPWRRFNWVCERRLSSTKQGNTAIIRELHPPDRQGASVIDEILAADSVASLACIGRRLPAVQLQLTIAHTSTLHLGEVISSCSDALTRRLLELAEQKYGAPPVPYAWLAGGSQGRREQTSLSDQDNALLLDDSFNPQNEEYFLQLSRFVSDGLHACGFAYCQGDAMATNASWRKPLRVWMAYFSKWITRPEKKALMLACIFFDVRPVYGAAWLFERLQKNILAKSKSNEIFLAHMVSNALTHRPPLGFFGRFTLARDRQHAGTMDIKHGGIVPIVDIARVLALSAGIAEVNTTRRLLEAQVCGSVSETMAADLLEALEFIGAIRLHHQAKQIQQGIAPDNHIAPGSMSGRRRWRLKQAFKIIKSMQQVLASRYEAGLVR